MKKFSFKCTCGDVMTVDADNREEAIEKLKGMMTADMIASHMSEKHSGDPVPTVEQVHMQMEQGVYEESEAPAAA